MGLGKAFHKTINKVTGSSKIKKQYEESHNNSYRLESQMLANLYSQRCNQHLKIAAQRQAVQRIKQQQSEQFLQQKTLLHTLQIEKEASFNKASQKIKEDMQLMRAALYACMTGNLDILEPLLKSSATLRFAFFNLHPLHIAAQNNQIATIKLLCRYGVNIYRINASGYSALDLAAEQGHVEAIELLHHIAKVSEMLWIAAKAGDIPAIKEALQRGADINATDSEGYTALQRVITQTELHLRHYQTIVFLIASGADVAHQSNTLNKDALELAINHLDARVGAFFLLTQGLTRTHAWLMEYQDPQALAQSSSVARLRAHLVLKNQGEKLKNQPGVYFFNGMSLVKTLEVPKNAVGNYFDFNDCLKQQLVYFLLEHHDRFYKDYGFAYLVSECPIIVGADKQSMLVNHGYASPLFNAYYNNPTFNRIDAHLRLKRQAVFYRDIPGAYFFDGNRLAKVSSQPDGTIGNYFDFADFDVRLKRQLVFYYPRHQSVLYQEKGFAYLVSKSPIVVGADRQAMLVNYGYASPEIAFYYEHPVLQHIDEHLTLQSEAIALHEAPGEYFFDGDNINKATLPPQWAVGNYFDFGVKPQMIYYYPMHESTLYRKKGFAYLVSKSPIVVGADRQAMLVNYGYASPEMVFFYQGVNGFSREQEVLNIQKASVFLRNLLKHSQDLLTAAEQGDWIGVQASLLQGADVNITDDKGYNALQKAIVAKKISLELFNGLIKAGIDLAHKTAQQQNALELAREHLPEFATDEPVMGMRYAFPATLEAQRIRFQEHHERAQRFLDNYVDEGQKIQAMFAYYLWLSKSEPYAIYAWPAMLMLSQLQKISKCVPDGLLKSLPVEQSLKAAQVFFKKIRAVHCLVNELGIVAAMPFLATDGFKEIDWTMVLRSVRLKQEASRLGTKTRNKFLLEGTRSFIREFIIQVFGFNRADFEDNKIKWVNEAAQYLVKQQQAGQSFKQVFHEKALVEAIHKAFESGLVQLPAKRSLKESLKTWESNERAVQAKIHQGEEELEQEKVALNQWINQREAEYMAQLERHLQWLSDADSEVVQQHQKAYEDLRANFNRYRAELEHNYHATKHKIEQHFLRNCVAIAAAAIIAPQLAPSLAGKLGAIMGVTAHSTTAATLAAVVEGALTGALSAGFSGNTSHILKDGFIGGWLAGFGVAMGGILEKSTAVAKMNNMFSYRIPVMKVSEEIIERGVVTQAAVTGLKAAVQVGVEGGKLSTGLLTSIGSTLALGGSKELPFIAKMNEQLVSVLVSGAVVSLVTKSDFLENIAKVGVTDLVQTTAQHLGNKLKNLAATEQALELQDTAINAEEPVVVQTANEPVEPPQNKVQNARLKTERLKPNTYSLLTSQQATQRSNTERTEALGQPVRSKGPTKLTLTRKGVRGKDARNGFELVRDTVVGNFAEGVLRVVGVGDLEAAELNSNEKTLIFSFNPQHKKFFAGRFLPEKQKSQNEQVDFLTKNRELIQQRG